MEIFCRLLLGHLLADFTFQTNFIARWKRERLGGLLTHVAIHPICYIPLVFPYINDTWVTYGGVSLNGWSCIAIAVFLHFVEDWFRVSMVVGKNWPDNTLFYLWDQVIHIVVLWLLTPVGTQPIQTLWPLVGIMVVIVTHFATVTVWFVEKDVYGRDYPQTEEKYITIFQRLVIYLSFFLPHPLWIFVALFFIVSFARHIWSRRVDFSWASVVMGNLLAVSCGLLTRFGLKAHF